MAPQTIPDFRVIPHGDIDEPALPSRTEMDEQKLDELVASMQRDGFNSVIGVLSVGDRYEVIFGHRRWHAARRAGIVALPCFVYANRRDAAMRLQYGENWLREDVSVTDEAILFAQLLDAEPEMGTDGLASRVGQSRAYVEGRIALLRGCERVFAALKDKTIPIGVAHELNKCTEDTHRFLLLDMAIRGGSTVGLVRQWVQEWRTIHAPAAAGPAAPVVGAGGPSPIIQEYFRCRQCGETHNTANMLPVQIHDYCLQQLTDPATGMFRSRADYVIFPTTREEAIALVRRVVTRFPELADEPAA
jgi:ParB/RepB/Spo0J family partition protein